MYRFFIVWLQFRVWLNYMMFLFIFSVENMFLCLALMTWENWSSMACLGLFLLRKLILLQIFFAKKELFGFSFPSFFNLKQHSVECVGFLPHLVQKYSVLVESKFFLYLVMVIFLCLILLGLSNFFSGFSFYSIASQEAINFSLVSNVGV